MSKLWRSSASAARFLGLLSRNFHVERSLCSKPPEEPTHIVEPPIPKYEHRAGEEMETKRARLLYQSRKRGMAENGLLLSTFAGEHLKSLSSVQLDAYDKLINEPTNDWEIYYWITETKPTPEEYKSDVMEMLKTHTKNTEKKVRIVQPDLYA